MVELEKKNLKENPLAKSLSSIRGISENTSVKLAKHQVVSLFDLFLHTPKSVVEQIDCPGFLYMENGRHYRAKGRVLGTKLSKGGSKKRLEAILQDETGRISLVFFGPAVNYAQAILKIHQEIAIAGEAKIFLGRTQMIHPKLKPAQDCTFQPSIPSYSQIGGINSASFKRTVDKALAYLKNHAEFEYLDMTTIKTLNLVPLSAAIFFIHEFSDKSAWDKRGQDPSYRRLAFEEILSFYLRLNLLRAPTQKSHGCALKKSDCNELIKNFLPFTLTKAQRRTIDEIIVDMSKNQAMTRLLQGDVGSGKTAVSAIISRHAVNANLQVALMAPTEILAEQLFEVYANFFKGQARLALLTASIKSKERKDLLLRLEQHDIDIAIGTHALLTEDVIFKRLGLIIVDEQHRFGVKQRAELVSQAHSFQNFCPHLLVMSATPIPRSLALTMYGDLDLSVIDERPEGRLPIHTQIFSGPVLKSLEKLCERILLTKQKAFIVFPLVEESEHFDLENATNALCFLKEKFGDQSALLLHGKMKGDEKTLVMKKFRENTVSFLVATTVVEVGVDIPDATCMIIVHPERFGLAQLHQLRGRVGRGELKSFCFLVSDMTNKMTTAYKRLDAMCKTDNGFKLAEIDLEIRGPGELLGIKQSGLPNFVVFNHLEFADLIVPAKECAKTLIKRGLGLEHEHLFHDKASHVS